jgi:hypothetical protein
MRPQPLRERIVGALRLQPMTKSELAQCLSLTYSRIEQGILPLRHQGSIRPSKSRKPPARHSGRREWVWRIA